MNLHQYLVYFRHVSHSLTLIFHCGIYLLIIHVVYIDGFEIWLRGFDWYYLNYFFQVLNLWFLDWMGAFYGNFNGEHGFPQFLWLNGLELALNSTQLVKLVLKHGHIHNLLHFWNLALYKRSMEHKLVLKGLGVYGMVFTWKLWSQFG